jgi:hypothetical protein
VGQLDRINHGNGMTTAVEKVDGQTMGYKTHTQTFKIFIHVFPDI